MYSLRCIILACLSVFTLAAHADEKADRFLASARNGDLASVRSLLADGVNINAQTPFGATAIAYAAEHGYLDMVRALVGAGANIKLKDPIYQRTPADWAAKRKNLDVLQILVQAGAIEVETAIVLGAEAGHIGLVRAVLASGAADGKRLSEALVFAKQFGHDQVVEVLVAAGAQPLAVPPTEIPMATLEDMAGVYIDRRLGWQFEARRFGPMLKGVFTGQQEFTYVPVTETTFSAMEVPDITFEFDFVDGQFVGATLTQSNQPMVYDRVGRRSSLTNYIVEPGKPAVEDRPRPFDGPLNWPQFRGAGAAGLADGQHLPIHWNVDTGQNVRWKAPIPGLGHGSPIVWNDRVYVLTAVASDGQPEFEIGRLSHVDLARDKTKKHAWRLLCLDKQTGNIVWDKTIHEGLPRTGRHIKSSHANSTPATDGKHIVVIAGSQGLYCFDLDGKLLWNQDLGILDAGWFWDPSYQWGFASSPIIHDGRVFVQSDIPSEAFIAAFDVGTGQQLWKTRRVDVSSWSTPTIVRYDDKTELITNGSIAAGGYDPDTGGELWHLSPGSYMAMPTPVQDNDRVYVTSGYNLKLPLGYRGPRPVYAVKLGARGDISLPPKSDSNDFVLWHRKGAGPFTATPVAYKGYLYTLDFNGVIGALDPENGDASARHSLGGCGAFSASPIAADGRLYYFSEEGEAFVRDAHPPEMTPLAVNLMREPVIATPAVSDGTLFIRTVHHVYAIAHSGLPANAANGSEGATP